jgi:probable rRNA maturation factor
MNVKTVKRLSVEASGNVAASMITTANRQRTQKINLPLLKRIAERVLIELKIPRAKLEINLVAENEMVRVNEKFLRHAGSTDVITFDYSEERKALHGEILICVDEALAQARKFKTTWQSEVSRCLIHGVLHLAGHDDSRAAERRKMKREENGLLRRISQRFSLAELDAAAKLSACTSR